MTQQKTDNKFEPAEKENEKGRHVVFLKLCKGCGICVEICPKKCLKLDKEKSGVYNNPVAKVDIDKCIFCGQCELRCPDSAIRVEKK